MDPQRNSADVLIAGGGPAGAAAAIACRQAGLSVILCERQGTCAEKPGEALHPGVESLLRQLGAEGALTAAGARFSGVEIDWNGAARFEAFGADESGPWLGYQVRRADFDARLLRVASGQGAEVRMGAALTNLRRADDHWVAAVGREGEIKAAIVIDATGPARWLARRLDLPSTLHSPPLIVRYGYVRGDCPARRDAPSLVGDAAGWTWIARVGDDTYQWARLDLAGAETGPPPELAALTSLGKSKGAEMSWRISPSAGPGWFLAGDAAATLDPTSSHGVLKALMSGVMAAQTAAAILARGAPSAEGAAAYRAWLEGWFRTDVAELGKAYAALGATGWGST